MVLIPTIVKEKIPQERPENIKIAVIICGVLCILLTLLRLPKIDFSWGFGLILLFGIFLAPRMSIKLPRSRFTLSFSDAVVFLTFLFWGGELAIITAFVETFASCLYLKRRGSSFGPWMTLFNSSLAASITGLSYGIFLISGLSSRQINSTRDLIAALGLFSLCHFFFASGFAAIYQRIRNGSSIWETWKRHGLSVSLTQFTGAGLAAIVYKVINYSDLLIMTIGFIVLAIAYLNYRLMIKEVSNSFVKIEEAEREKAELEKVRREEAERHADQLSVSLDKEERANAALRKSEKDLQHAAMHDALTGLPNRKHFGEVLRKLIERYKRDSTTNFQVLFLDIKSFKNINDTLGHTIGDKVLSIAAKRFVRMLNSNDTVARIGGDEFAIVLRDLTTPGKAQKVARRIHQSITQPFSLGGNRISMDLNIGIAPCDAEYSTPEEILRDADIAMHFAKERNNGFAVFTRDLREKFMERAVFEMDLRHATDRNELSVHYQPIVSLRDGRLLGFEALLRWHHPEFGMIPPNKFIPIAEQSGLIQPLTVWILEETARQLSRWQKIAPEYAKLVVSVNISGKHLSNDDLIDDVEVVLDKTGIAPDSLKLEITESSAMENAEHTIELLNRLKRIGVQLSIDDFGTGYSSLSYLHRLPFDTLKIDRSFVYNVGENGENSEILQTIISLANNLRMRVIAEGIETMSQLFVLQNLGCDLGQGFLLARPKPKEETEDLLYQRKNWLPYNDQPFDQFVHEGQNFNLPIF